MSEISTFTLGIVFGALLGLLLNLYQRGNRQMVEGEVNMLSRALAEREGEMEKERERNRQLIAECAQLATTHARLADDLTKQEEKQQAMATQLSTHFQNVANKLFEAKQQNLSTQNKVQMELLLKPLQENLHAFNQLIHQRDTLLHAELKQLKTLNSAITREASNLTSALKGSNKVQGNWGEFILEQLLTQSGLVEGRNYTVQGSFAEDGKRYQPDVILHLPEKKSLIIDAKVSLLHYAQHQSSNDSEAQKKLLTQHVASIKRHIKQLSEKNYSHRYSLEGLDFVLLFIPIESAFMCAMQAAPELLDYAHQHNIAIVSPTTLMTTLRTIAHLWRITDQNEHVLEIAAQSGALYDKLVGFVDELRKLGNQLATTQRTYEGAIKKLSEGKGNLIGRAERIRALGARTTKRIAGE